LAKCKQEEKIAKNSKEGKRNQKKRHPAAFVSVPSVFGEKFPTEILKMISAETSCWEIERK
jgi:hypothetical protein